jgi:hypothetical protein
MQELDVPYIAPQLFFAFELNIKQFKKETWEKHRSEYLLPSLCHLFRVDEFAKVFAAWDTDGLYFSIDCTVPEISVSYPDIQSGDSIELFIDTKNVKNAKIPHRFCHHFFFLPERVEGVLCKEITRFREDAHPLCQDTDLLCNIEKKKKGYSASIVIPSMAFCGYQGEEGASIGFSYRINRKNGPSQQIAYAPESTDIAAHPYLWITVQEVL